MVKKGFAFVNGKDNAMKKHAIGVMITCLPDTDLEAKILQAKDMGMESCQLCIWETKLFVDNAYADYVKAVLAKTAFRVSSLWAGWSGPCEWNFTAGPTTIGLVPPAYRFQRLQELMTASDFAEKIGVSQIATHVGFLPESPDDPDFNGTVAALRKLCLYMKSKNQYFLFETGQETPVTMLRAIRAIGTDNIGVNFDTANLMIYGKANSLDALDTFGKYVMDTHIKDGLYPTEGMKLGLQMKVGEGMANIPEVIKRLQAVDYKGNYIVEREISGDQQMKDIADTVEYLKQILR